MLLFQLFLTEKFFLIFIKKWKENLILETYASPDKINTPKVKETQLGIFKNSFSAFGTISIE